MINRTYRDTLFRFIFGKEDHKEWLLSLYNVLNQSDYDNPDELEIKTLNDVIYIGMKNDVSFIKSFRGGNPLALAGGRSRFSFLSLAQLYTFRWL